MKHLICIVVIAFLTGCISDDPLLPSQDLPLDDRLFGVWECVDGRSKYSFETGDRWRILSWDATTYAVQKVGSEKWIKAMYPVDWEGTRYYVADWTRSITNDEAGYMTLQIELLPSKRLRVRYFDMQEADEILGKGTREAMEADERFTSEELQRLMRAPRAGLGWSDWSVFKRVEAFEPRELVE